MKFAHSFQTLSESTHSQLKKNVYQNYRQFIDTAKEIGFLEKEMYQLSHMITDQRNLLLGTIHILRKHFYSTRLNLTSKFFTKTGFFHQNKRIYFSPLHFDENFHAVNIAHVIETTKFTNSESLIFFVV